MWSGFRSRVIRTTTRDGNRNYTRGKMTNPSRCAASRNRCSRQTNSRCNGSPRHQTIAAASCKESAARNGCKRRTRAACSRTASLGSTSVQLAIRARNTAWACPSSSRRRASSLLSLARAERHSIGEAHHATMDWSARISFLSDGESRSCRHSGISADAAQNFIAPQSDPPEALQALGLSDLWASAVSKIQQITSLFLDG